MQEQLILLVNQLLRFLLMILTGFILIRTRRLDRSDFDAIAKVVVKILLPLFMLTTIPAAGTQADLIRSLPLLGASYLLVWSLFGLGALIARLLGMPDRTARIHTICTGVSNIGFMGIPLAEALFGAPGILGASIYALANDSSMWTLGKAILTAPDRSEKSDVAVSTDNAALASNRRKRLKLPDLRNLFTLSLVSVLIGFVLLALGINPVGNVVWDTMKTMGIMAKYLPMIYIGGVLGSFNFHHMKKYWTAVLIILSKMIGAAVLVYFVSGWLLPDLSQINRMTLTIGAALPSMASSAAIAGNYGADAEYAAGCITLTTLASLISMPTVFWLISLF